MRATRNTPTFWATRPRTSCIARFIRPMRCRSRTLIRISFEIPTKVARTRLRDMLEAYEDETDEPFPQDPARQLADVLQSMARAWEGTTARLLRQAQGAPADAGLGLVVQAMAPGLGPPELVGRDPVCDVGHRAGPDHRALSEPKPGPRCPAVPNAAVYLTRDPRGPSLEELCPEGFRQACGIWQRCAGRDCAKKCRSNLRLMAAS